MYRQRRFKQQAQPEELNRWLVSYADYMTLMFALFVVLYALSLLKQDEFTALTDSITKVFEKAPRGEANFEHLSLMPTAVDSQLASANAAATSLIATETALTNTAPLSDIRQQYLGTPLAAIEQNLRTVLSDLIDQGVTKLIEDDDWLVIELNSALLFASGSATATSSARTVLQEISKIINPINNFLRVRGYTDNIPIRNELFSSNWELSVARATSVLRVLESLGTAPQRMAIEGFGEYYPTADNATASGRAENRKVAIAISRFGYQSEAPVFTEQNDVLEQQLQQVTQADGSIQVVPLPGGGIRITTRRDNPDALTERQDP